MKLIIILNARPLKIPPVPQKLLKLLAVIAFIAMSVFTAVHMITAYEKNQAKLAWEKKESESFRKLIAEGGMSKGIYAPVNLNGPSPKFIVNSDGKVEVKFETSP